jgi:hypothetical protein
MIRNAFYLRKDSISMFTAFIAHFIFALSDFNPDDRPQAHYPLWIESQKNPFQYLSIVEAEVTESKMTA